MAVKRIITNEPGWVSIIKPADTNRTSDTTLSDDPHMLFPMEANSAYFIDMFINLYVRANPDFKYAISVPSGGFFRSMQRIVAQNTTITQDIITSVPGSTALTTTVDNYGFIRITGPYTNGANTGNWAFQWAQNTTDGTNAATVVQGSMIRYFRLN